MTTTTGTKMTAKKEIIAMIEGMSGSYAPYNIFSDWIQMSALAIQNSCCVVHGDVWKYREQLYIDTARKYSDQEMDKFAKMFVLLGDALTEEMTDVLGEIYMEAGMGSKYTGQFFTPFHLSELCAKLAVENLIKSFDGKMATLNEPSCGGGGMIIAACKVLHEAGFDFQRKLTVIAQDLDWKGVYMTYLQLSLIGSRALVVQGDTLMHPYDPKQTDPAHIFRTPAYLGALP